MRKYFLSILIIPFLSTAIFAQQNKKPSSKEKAPTQKEMEEMMKELEKMSPEDKKMMEQMGIKIPSIKDMPKVSDKELADAWEDENRIVPKKDDARIAAISKTPLTISTIPGFLNSVQSFVHPKLKSSSKFLAEKIFTALKNSNNNMAVIGNNAALLWVHGKIELALYIMGKTCIADPSNTDNLSNYASMLSMCGGEQLAVPLLDHLNKRFPKNSTILNNLGQAWFGLGDIPKAEKYLDSTIRLYTYHPQATHTKASIEESKGHEKEAIELLKRSILHSYTEEKEDHLKKAGYKITGDDLRWKLPMKDDGLGLGHFVPPVIPKSVGECIVLDPEWKQFREACNQEINNLNAKLKKAEAVMQKLYTSQQANGMRMANELKTTGGMPRSLLMRPPLWEKAVKKQPKYIDDFTRNSQKQVEHWKKYVETVLVPQKQNYENDMKEIRKRSNCGEMISRTDNFLKVVNNECEIIYLERLNITKRMISDMLKWNIYTQWPEEFEVTKLSAQVQWLQTLKDVTYESNTICNNRQDTIKNRKLPDFDVVNCQLDSKWNYGLGSIQITCTRMITNFDAKFIQLGLVQDLNKADFGDSYLGCTVKIGVEESIGKIDAGPLRLEAKAGLGLEFEFDRSGIKDVAFVSVVKGGSGTNAVEIGEEKSGIQQGIGGNDFILNSVEVGVTGKVSLISGKASMEVVNTLKENYNNTKDQFKKVGEGSDQLIKAIEQ
jgi:tetratricopeptide (TPR) repeat protein